MNTVQRVTLQLRPANTTRLIMTNHQPRWSRRTALKTLGTGVALLSSGAAIPVAAHDGSLEEELENLRTATAKYTNAASAYEDGWVALADPSDPATEIALEDAISTAEFICGQGVHLWNLELVGTADPTKPPVLAYGIHDGTLVLGALDYVVPKEGEFESSSPDFFEYDDGAEEWHTLELPLGEVWAMHAWVHYPNPDGVFVDNNPRQAYQNHSTCG